MNVDEAADRLQQLLTDAGLDQQLPDPVVVWAIFKQFVAEPVDAQTVEVWFEAADGDPTTNSPAYFDFVRMFTHDTDDGIAWGEQITAHFTASPISPPMFGKGYSIHAADVNAPQSWFAAVETSSAFQVGLKFKGWTFEVRIDGC